MFAMKLALRIGCTLSELCERMTLTEFKLWLAFDSLSPVGDERADLLHAIGAYASVRPHARSGSSLKVADFMPNWSDIERRQRQESQIGAYFQGLVAKTGGKST